MLRITIIRVDILECTSPELEYFVTTGKCNYFHYVEVTFVVYVLEECGLEWKIPKNNDRESWRMSGERKDDTQFSEYLTLQVV